MASSAFKRYFCPMGKRLTNDEIARYEAAEGTIAGSLRCGGGM